jgi:hypothetical protein
VLSCQLLVPQQQIVEYLDQNAYLLKCPASSVPQAMRACKNSDKESSDAAKQMAVRRLCNMQGGTQEEEEAPPPCRICASSPALSVSPIRRDKRQRRDERWGRRQMGGGGVRCEETRQPAGRTRGTKGDAAMRGTSRWKAAE